MAGAAIHVNMWLFMLINENCSLSVLRVLQAELRLARLDGDKAGDNVRVGTGAKPVWRGRLSIGPRLCGS